MATFLGGARRTGLQVPAVGTLIASALAALVVFAPAAGASTITVDSLSDGEGDDSACTLREAIKAANDNTASTDAVNGCIAGTANPDTIDFAASFNGEAADTISSSSLPAAAESMIINGGNCGTMTLPVPCVGLDLLSTDTGPSINEAGSTLSVRGLAITGGFTGIWGLDGGLSVKGNWIGRGLDGTYDGNNSGVLLDGGATVPTTIGGSPNDRNVIAGNTTFDGTGVYIVGGDNATISGNYFSTAPDGTAATGSANDYNIRIWDKQSGPDAATNNVIGGAHADADAVCDGPCNLIGNANVEGINLTGQGQEDPATGPTTIEGNFIGLNLAGDAGLGNSDSGIDIGDADSVTVGGPDDLSRNYIAANGSAGIGSGDGATDLLVQNNFLGLSADGGTGIPDSFSELDSDSTSFLDNRVAEDFDVQSANNTLQGNVFGIGTGGENVDGSGLDINGTGGNQIGGTAAGDGNTIGNAATAIHIGTESNGNTLEGNLIGVDANGVAHPNEAGIIVEGDVGTPTDTTIGGNSAASENVISNSQFDAVQFENGGSGAGNEFLRNRGRNNGGGPDDMFFDLRPGNGPGNLNWNNAIAAPTVSSVTATTISGSAPGTTPGSDIRVYSTFTDRHDVKAFLGSTTTDGSNNWSVTHPALANGTCVTANVTDPTDGSSELALATPVGGGVCDVTPPVASFTSGPSGPTKDSTPTFGFASNEPGSTFECHLDNAAYAPCGSTHTTSALSAGPHTIKVRATDPVGNTGNEATRSFTVDTTAPNTILKGAKKKAKKRKITIKFGSSEGGSSFKCKLDKKKLKSCNSPKTYKKLKPGKHKIKIEAIDAAGNIDATPILVKIKIRATS